MKKILVLGTSCQKCMTLEKSVRSIVDREEIDAAVEKVEDIMEIMNYGVMSTPALVLDGKVVVKGRVPSEEEILKLLK